MKTYILTFLTILLASIGAYNANAQTTITVDIVSVDTAWAGDTVVVNGNYNTPDSAAQIWIAYGRTQLMDSVTANLYVSAGSGTFMIKVFDCAPADNYQCQAKIWHAGYGIPASSAVKYFTAPFTPSSTVSIISAIQTSATEADVNYSISSNDPITYVWLKYDTGYVLTALSPITTMVSSGQHLTTVLESLPLSGLTQNAIYSVCVLFMNSTSVIQSSDTIQFLPVGEEELKMVSVDVKVFPNPFFDKAIIRCSKQVNGKILIWNMLGQHIETVNMLNGIAVIERGNKNPGQYIFQIKSADGEEIKRSLFLVR